MPLTVGSRIGPYEVLGVLGAGGMGEVYRARDTKLQRDVAIKVLPAAMADNPRRLMRFEREARALAALNHPNIATVYGIEEPSDDATHSRALIMELVAGEDLSWRLKRGPLPLADALPIAKQVAEALAAAHDAGIVHRDLKPANIKVRADGTVKVLDFGLATDRATETESSSGSGSGSASGSASGSGTADLPNTQTLGAELTEDGAVLGTAAYMAPEQAKGQPVDKRADIWAFGIVLFEMLAGRRPFAAPTGSDPADTMARVLAADPDWSGLPAATPPPVRRLLARCLTKDRKQRLHDIADARLEIDEAMAPQLPGSWTASARETAAAGARRRLRTVLLVALGLAAGIAIGVAIWRPAADGSLPVTYARIGVLPAAEVDAGGVHPAVVLPTGGARTALAWSPDGRRLAFIGARDGVRQIYIRDLSSEIARALAGTEGAGALAFSPDGNEVAFWSDGALRRVQVDGGPPATVCASGTVSGITWGAGRIIFTPGGLWTADLSGSGSECRPLRQPPELVRYASPLILPGGTAVLYTELTKQWTSGDERVMALPLTPGGEPTLLLSNAADAHFLPSGHLAFLRQGTIFVVPFDARSLQLSGEPVAVLQNVAQSTIAWDSADLTLAGQFSVSSQGALAYIAAPPAAPAARELVSIDRQGTATSLGAPVKGYRNHVEISPDGRRLAVAVQTTTDVQLFSFDLTRQTLSRVAESIHGEVVLGAWARDGRIAVGVVDGGKISTAIVRPDVSSPAEPVPDTTGFWPSTFSPDGRLAGMKEGGVWVYSLGANGAPPHALVTSRAEIRSPAWSPDGRWIAYASATTGRSEVYVRPVQGPGEAVMVSTQGGNSPAWNPNGRELFFIAPGALEKMMAATFTASGKVTRLTELFAFAPGQSFGATVFAPYAVAPDGQRFYASRPLSGPRRQATEINVVFNWLDTIQRQPPVKR